MVNHEQARETTAVSNAAARHEAIAAHTDLRHVQIPASARDIGFDLHRLDLLRLVRAVGLADMKEATAMAAGFTAGVLAIIAEHGGGGPLFWVLSAAMLAAAAIQAAD